jgi:hypothetical protein
VWQCHGKKCELSLGEGQWMVKTTVIAANKISRGVMSLILGLKICAYKDKQKLAGYC